MRTADYHIFSEKLTEPVCLALLSDFHNKRKCLPELFSLLGERKPDALMICGDVCNDHLTEEENEPGREFLKRCAEAAPSFYALGNHEWQFTETDKRAAEALGVTLLDNRSVPLVFSDGRAAGILLGGFTSACKCGIIETRENLTGRAEKPDLAFLDAFEKEEGFKLLLSHQPEYYPRYLKGRQFDLIVSGHAHGGQIRIGKRRDGVGARGLFAPGQGFFPQYTSGLHDGRLLISRGLTNTARIPRIGNPTEIPFIYLEPKKRD